jgi:hypothetical protein
VQVGTACMFSRVRMGRGRKLQRMQCMRLSQLRLQLARSRGESKQLARV